MTPSDVSSSITGVDFYWRPGCPFCMSLERKLSKAGITMHKRNIWEDPDAAAHVRSVADGNETVPTITIDGVSMVNPGLKQVVSVLRDKAPHLNV